MSTGYTWDNAMVEGRRRLALLEDALDPTTFRRMAEIGVGEGWRVLELGAGGGSVTDWLCKRVGGNGHVCAVDIDARFVKALPHDNLDVREQNILECDLSEGSFDMVHSRWTLLHIDQREQVIDRLIDLLKPGGVLFLEEADGLPVYQLDGTGFYELTKKIFPIIAARGSDPEWARFLPGLISGRKMEQLRAESEFPWFRGQSGLAEFWKISWTRVRDGVAASGANVEQWDRELAEFDDPTKLFTAPMTVGVWARKPE